MSASSSATCCESAPRSVSDVAAGSTPAAAAAAAATLCLAPYDGRLLGSARPELGTALGIYGAPYAAAAAAAQSYPGYLPYSPEPPTLYGALVSTRGGDWVCAPGGRSRSFRWNSSWRLQGKSRKDAQL